MSSWITPIVAGAVLAVMYWPSKRGKGEWMAVRPFLTADGRRAMALILLAGGGVAMTAFAAVSLWLVRHRPDYAFWLGLAALALVAIVLTGFAGLIVRRTVKVGREGLEISDLAAEPGATVTTTTAVTTPPPNND